MRRALMLSVAAAGPGRGLQWRGWPDRPTAAPKTLRFALIPEVARHPGLRLREQRRRARSEGARQRRGHLPRTGSRRPAEAEGNPRVVHHAERGRHRDLRAQRRLPDEHDRQGHRRGHSRSSRGTPTRRRPSASRSTASTTSSPARSWASRPRKLLNGKGTVAFITSLGANNLQRRLDGAKDALAKYPGHQDRRDVRHQGRRRALRRDDRDRHEPVSGSRRLDFRRRLAGVHRQRARRRSIRRRPSSSRSTRSRRRPTCSRRARCRCCSARSTSAGAARPSSCSTTSSTASGPQAPSSTRASTSSRKTTSTSTSPTGTSSPADRERSPARAARGRVRRRHPPVRKNRHHMTAAGSGDDDLAAVGLDRYFLSFGGGGG